MPSRRLALVLATGLATAAGATAVAAPGRSAPRHPGDRPESRSACARTFDATVSSYVTTTQQRDVAGFTALLDPRVVLVFRPGSVLYGKGQTTAFIKDFFADPGWTQSFRVITKTVAGCRSAFVLFDSVYSASGADPLPLVIGVSFTRRDGRWLAIHNQDSQGPADPPDPPDPQSGYAG